MRPMRQPATSGDLYQKIVAFPIFGQAPPHEPDQLFRHMPSHRTTR
jgi:hypothetical protein